MKKIVALLIVFCMLIPFAVFAQDNITVAINGTPVDFLDQHPVIVDGRTLVPFRAIAESLGCMVEWDAENRVVFIASGRIGTLRIIGLPIDKTEIEITDYSNSEEGPVTKDSSVTTDVPASIINDRTMVPLRVITELFGGTATWDDSSKTASIEMDLTQNVVATDEECKKFMDNYLFKAKHILITVGEDHTDEEAKAIADDLCVQLKGGADFDMLMNEFSEDPGTAQYPDGYIFAQGEMVPEFEVAVMALGFDEITSEPVKSDYGYHVIKRERFTQEEYLSGFEAFRFIVLASLCGLDI